MKSAIDILCLASALGFFFAIGFRAYDYLFDIVPWLARLLKVHFQNRKKDR